MATIVESIEISRRPEDVFVYATDFSHFPEWQGGVVSARREGDAEGSSPGSTTSTVSTAPDSGAGPGTCEDPTTERQVRSRP